MRSSIRFLVLLFAAAFLPAGLGAAPNKPHIAVPAALNLTELPAFDPGAKAAWDTVVTILAQTGKYDLVPWKNPSPASGFGPEWAREAENRSLDFVVLIQLEKASGRSAVCRLRVWDRAKNAVTLEKASPPVELIDIFDACDQAAADLLGRMTGVHIAFGSIVLKPEGGTQTYEVTLDGQVLDPSKLSKVLAGNHELSVRTGASEGGLTLVRITPLTVAEDTQTLVSFRVPDPAPPPGSGALSETSPVKTYQIGDWGPALGYVFYDKGSYSDGWRYLEANPKAFQISYKINNFSHEEGGVTDWRLPTVDEMKLIRSQLQEKGLDVYPRDRYMTADENNDQVFLYDLGSNSTSTISRRQNTAAFFYVIPVRAF